MSRNVPLLCRVGVHRSRYVDSAMGLRSAERCNLCDQWVDAQAGAAVEAVREALAAGTLSLSGPLPLPSPPIRRGRVKDDRAGPARAKWPGDEVENHWRRQLPATLAGSNEKHHDDRLAQLTREREVLLDKVQRVRRLLQKSGEQVHSVQVWLALQEEPPDR